MRTQSISLGTLWFQFTPVFHKIFDSTFQVFLERKDGFVLLSVFITMPYAPVGLGKITVLPVFAVRTQTEPPSPLSLFGIKPLLDGTYPSQDFLSGWDSKPVNSSHCHMGLPGSLGKVQSVALRQLRQSPGNTLVPAMVLSSLNSFIRQQDAFSAPRNGDGHGKERVTSWAIFYLLTNHHRIDKARRMPLRTLKNPG